MLDAGVEDLGRIMRLVRVRAWIELPELQVILTLT